MALRDASASRYCTDFGVEIEIWRNIAQCVYEATPLVCTRGTRGREEECDVAAMADRESRERCECGVIYDLLGSD